MPPLSLFFFIQFPFWYLRWRQCTSAIGTTSIHVNPTPFLIEGLPILPFVTFGGKKKKQCC
jgi:hypothetical protein